VQDGVLEVIRKEYPQSPSLERTKQRLGTYKIILEGISNPNISLNKRKAMAHQIIPIQRSIKRLKETMPENKFFLFYKNVIEGQSIKSLSIDYGVDTKTVRRAKNHAIRKLSILLYSDLVIAEIYTVGW